MVSEVFSKDVRKKLVVCIQKVSVCLVWVFNQCSSTFEVQKPYDLIIHQYGQCYKVDLTNCSCDCGEFKFEKFPCAHAFTTCAKSPWTQLNLLTAYFGWTLWWTSTTMTFDQLEIWFTSLICWAQHWCQIPWWFMTKMGLGLLRSGMRWIGWKVKISD